MKCPKCGYLGFEPVDRCRNCGYDFSLSTPENEPELPMKERDGPAVDDEFTLPEIPLTPLTPSELSLFGDEEPLITKPSPPRTPLAVRRSTPEVPRLRSETRPTSLDLGFDPKPFASSPSDDEAAMATWAGSAPVGDLAEGPIAEAAGLGARIGAAVIDLAILGIVDFGVVYFTLQICGVSVEEFALVPKVPLAAFLVAQNLGYLVAFTAGGQTLGKVAMGIRVVRADAVGALDLGRAAMRTLIWVALAVPAGLGFLTALAGRDHRGLHDRFAGTRVVRV